MAALTDPLHIARVRLATGRCITASGNDVRCPRLFAPAAIALDEGI